MADDDAQAKTVAVEDPGTDYVELFSTILLALAAVFTAWAGFQAAKWGGVQASNTSQANADRTESVRESTRAGQQSTIDVTTFFQWLNSLNEEIDSGEVKRPKNGSSYEPTPGTLSGFTFKRLRPEFKPAVEAWLDTNPFSDPSAPPTPFAMPEYVREAQVKADELQIQAGEQATLAADANQNSDNYVISAVLFASALFFAALAGKLKDKRYRVTAIVIAALVFTGTLIYLLSLPIQL